MNKDKETDKLSCDDRFIDTYKMCTEEIHKFLWTAIDLKASMSQNQFLEKPLKNKNIISINIQDYTLLSLYTTIIISAVETLGATVQTLSPPHWEEEKYKSDLGRFYSMFCDAIIAQGHHHSSLCKLASGASVPVLNMSSHLFRPFHGLGMLMTIQEIFHKLKGLTVAWIGPPDSVLNTFLYLLPKVGIHFRYNCSCPLNQPFSPIVYPIGKQLCLNHDTTITEWPTSQDAIAGSDIIVTTNHSQTQKKVTLKVLEKAKPNWIFLHDLPRSGKEVSLEVFNHKNNIVWHNHKNVFYCIMAALLTTLKEYKNIIIEKPNFEGL